MIHRALLAATLVSLVASCGGGDDPAGGTRPLGTSESELGSELELTTVAEGLDTPWALAWDPDGRLWVTERPGRLRRVGTEPQSIEGVFSDGEGGLMGLEIDDEGRFFLMYTTQTDNRIVRLDQDARRPSSSTGSRPPRSTTAADCG